MGDFATTLLGPLPPVGSLAHDAYRRALLALRLQRCPLARTTTYYVAATGNDAAAGTIGAPWASVLKVNAVLAATVGDVAVLFKRGDEWRSTLGLLCNAPRVTLGAYGSGAKPRFSRVTNFFGGGAWVRTAGRATTYERDVPAAGVAWLWGGLLVDDYGVRAASVAEVDGAVVGQRTRWYYDAGAGKVYVSKGVYDDAWVAATNWHWVEDTGAGGSPGVDLGALADGCRVDSLQLDGWGMSPSTPNGLGYSIRSGVTGTNETLVTNCDVRFGINHLMGAYNGTGAGGITTWVANTLGHAQPGGGGLFVVSYARDGGAEAYWYDTTLISGEAPTVAGGPSGGMAGGHTGGGGAMQALLIYERTHALAGPYQAALPSGMTDTTEATGLVIDDWLEADATSVGQVGGPVAGVGFSCVRPRWHMRCRTGETGTVNFDTVARTGPVISGWVTIDLSGWAPVGFQRVNLIAHFAADYTARFVGTRFDVTGGAGGTFVFDLQSAFANPVGEVLEGCVLTMSGGSTAGNFQLPTLARNAYYGVTPAEVAADVHALFLADLPPPPSRDVRLYASPLYRALPLPLATAGVIMESDLFGRRRGTAFTDLGPVAPDDNVALTVADVLAAMEATPPPVNVVEINYLPAVPMEETVGTGTGDVPITHNGGVGVLVDGVASTVDCLRVYETGTGTFLDDVEIVAYLASEYGTGQATRKGETRSDSDGKWRKPLMLSTGIYILVFNLEGENPNTVELTIP